MQSILRPQWLTHSTWPQICPRKPHAHTPANACIHTPKPPHAQMPYTHAGTHMSPTHSHLPNAHTHTFTRVLSPLTQIDLICTHAFTCTRSPLQNGFMHAHIHSHTLPPTHTHTTSSHTLVHTLPGNQTYTLGSQTQSSSRCCWARKVVRLWRVGGRGSP